MHQRPLLCRDGSGARSRFSVGSGRAAEAGGRIHLIPGATLSWTAPLRSTACMRYSDGQLAWRPAAWRHLCWAGEGSMAPAIYWLLICSACLCVFTILVERRSTVARRLSAVAALVPIAGLTLLGSVWPSIHTVLGACGPTSGSLSAGGGCTAGASGTPLLAEIRWPRARFGHRVGRASCFVGTHVLASLIQQSGPGGFEQAQTPLFARTWSSSLVEAARARALGFQG